MVVWPKPSSVVFPVSFSIPPSLEVNIRLKWMYVILMHVL